MSWSSLPEHVNSPEEWNGKDDDQHFYTRWIKSVKGWFAYSYRSKYWWERWRKKPVVLLAFFGHGESRWENDLMALRSVNKTVALYYPPKNGWSFYLSRVQYWCDWHIQLQWPLFFAFHFKHGKTGLINFYIGAKRDADKVYWWPAIYVGTSYK